MSGRHESGFTLIEVIVALVVVALGAVTILPALHYAERRERMATARLEGLQVARARLELLTLEPTGDTLRRSGQDGRWRWTEEIAPLPALRPQLPAQLRELAVTVTAVGSTEPAARLSVRQVVPTAS